MATLETLAAPATHATLETVACKCSGVEINKHNWFNIKSCVANSVVPISVGTKKPLLSNLADDSTAAKVTNAPECSVYVAKD